MMAQNRPGHSLPVTLAADAGRPAEFYTGFWSLHTLANLVDT